MNDKMVIAGTTVDMGNFPAIEEEVIVQTFLKFVDVANTATNRATFYNSKEEQAEATLSMHKNLYGINRGIYAASLLLDGITDHTKMVGIQTLLGMSNPTDRDRSLITIDKETEVIAYVLTQLPVQRMLNLYIDLKSKRVNNSRTRRIIMLSILNSRNLEFWAVKYRNKLKVSIEHATGKKYLSIIKSILSKQDFKSGRLIYTQKEQEIMQSVVFKHVHAKPAMEVAECLAFILGCKNTYTLPILKSFVDAKTDLAKGNKLPREILEGIRSTYHKDAKTATVLETTKTQLTAKEKMKTQKNAAKHGVKVEFSAKDQAVVDLYIHSYANDNMVTPDVAEALKAKAIKAAVNSPLAYNKVGILIDGSASSIGNKTQHLKPIATNLAIRDLLVATSDKAFIEYAGGVVTDEGLVIPIGETNMAKQLVRLFKQEPDAIFILSDGYENAPAGRVDEIIDAVRKLGIDTPVFQISAVLAGEVGGVKRLSKYVSVLPVSKPEAIGFSMVKVMLEQSAKDGIVGLFNITLPKLALKK